jgi:hypothetical protein
MANPILFKTILLSIAIILKTQVLFAQTLIPYLAKNGTYGFATESGDLVIEPQFDRPQIIFEDNKMALDLFKDGKKVILLRDGETITDSIGSYQVMGINNYTHKDTTIVDNIPQLRGIYYKDSIRIYNKNNKINIVYIPQWKARNPDWFLEEPPYDYKDGSKIKFKYGALSIWKALGLLNFIDTDLKEIFPRYFAAGTIVDENYFILAEGPEQYAVADRKGRIRTSFKWQRISSSGKSGYFIVNNPTKSSSESKSRAGLIDKNGNIIIDTIYNLLTPVSESDLFIVEKEGKYGVYNLQNKPIVHIGEKRIEYLKEARCFQVGDSSIDILDITGKSILKQPINEITKFRGIDLPHYKMVRRDSQQTIQLFDYYMKPLLSINNVEDALWVHEFPKRFKVNYKTDTEIYYDLCDESGNKITDSQFQKLDLMWPLFGYFEVLKDGYFGVIDFEGKEIIPNSFESIILDTKNPDTILWCLPRDDGFWHPYDLKGMPMAVGKKLIPWLHFDPVISGYGNKRDRHQIITLMDGSRMPLPNSLRGWSFDYEQNFHSPEGGFVLFQKSLKGSGKAEKMWLNHILENITPPGFELPDDRNMNKYIKETGLLSVVSKTNRSDTSHVDNKNLENACGVINAKGIWVVPPKQNVKYFALSHDVIAEIPWNESLIVNGKNKYPVRLLAVNQPGCPIIEVNYIQNDHFLHNQKTMLVDVSNNEKTKYLGAYLETSGRLLTPFHIVNGPDSLKNHNLITIVPDGKLVNIRQQVVNSTGNILLNLDSLFCPNVPESRKELNNYWHFNYIVVQHLSITQEQIDNLKNFYGISPFYFLQDYRQAQGIMDSTGNIVVPVKFNHIQLIEPPQIFGAIDSMNRYVIYNWDGMVEYAFQPNTKAMEGNCPDPLYFKLLSDGRMFIGDKKSSVILTTDRKVEKELKYLTHSFKNSGHPDFYLAKDPEGRIFWVNMLTGVAFKE